MKKKKKKNRNNQEILKDRISKTKFSIPLTKATKTIKTNSWFDINNNSFIKTEEINKTCKLDDDNLILSDGSENKNLYKGLSLQFFPTKKQKNIINCWLESYRLMINATIKYYRRYLHNKEKIITSFMKVRTNHMKDIKTEIYNNAFVNDNVKTRIYSHTLDYAIKDVCTNVKSALSNLKNGNIKTFRLRYIKKTKKNKLFKLEKTALQLIEKDNKNIIYNNVLGKLKTKEDVPEINCDSTIMKRDNRYFIIIPVDIEQQNETTNKTIGLDAGLRTFLTGYNNEETIEICNNLYKTIQPINEQIDKIQSRYDKKEIKTKKGIEKRRRKIKNKIDDMHWKSINYLTNKYDNILLGNLSTKNIVSNNNIMSDNNKRVALAMRLYVFKQRLKYKCDIKRKRFNVINESYTSKICSSCVNINKEKNKTKKFECEKCKIKLDRDYNGAKNIYILGTVY